MAKLYLESGYIDFIKCEALSSTLNVMIGPRNSGKTIGALLHYTKCSAPFIFIRTTKAQTELVFSENLSPFNKINALQGSRFCVDKIPKSDLIGIYDNYIINEKGQQEVTGNLRGYALALSQVGATRGFNLDNVELLLYDEFVKHPGEVIQGANLQFSKYADIVFTINRDRELSGRPPIKQWLFGNSDDLANNILVSLKLVSYFIRMKQAGENYLKLPERDISLFLMDDSPIAAQLMEVSALSKIFAGSEYLDMALSNEFIHDDFSDCAPQDIHPFNPVFVYDNICIYRHKRKEEYYIREIKPGAAFSGIPRYAADDRGRINAREEHAGLYFCWLAGVVSFDSYNTKLTFFKLYNIK